MEDAVFYLRLLKSLIRHPESALLSPPLVPLMSLFVVESYDRLSEYSHNFRNCLSQEDLELIRPARHRAKLLLSSKNDINSVVVGFDRIVREEREFFMAPHTGWLGRLKRLIQPDVGLSMLNGHIFSTTHGTRFLLGINYQLA